jgi:predicted  nucleic acid-binding Zn-ribbon protein
VNLEAEMLELRMNSLRDESQAEINEYKAKVNALEVQICRLKEKYAEEIKVEYDTMMTQMKQMNQDAMEQLNDSHGAELHAVQLELQGSKDKIAALGQELDDMKIKYHSNLDAAREDCRAEKELMNLAWAKEKENFERDGKKLRAEYTSIKEQLDDLRTQLADAQNGGWEEQEEWDGYDEEAEEEGCEEDPPEEDPPEEDCKPDLTKMLAEMMAKVITGSKDDDSSKSKEADSIKIPQLPTAAQFKAWKNSVRSAISSASKIPAEAFQWVLEAEDAEATYEKLHDCPKKFDTLDAKLAAALTNICKGELSRKVILKTEEEAKAKRLIRGRQILWLVYEDYRINEEAGSLTDLSDLMKVVLRKDQSKTEHLFRFMMNWDSVLAGMSNPPSEDNLQVMLFDQVKHVPCLATDVAIYDRASPGSEDRS